ncbi:hypothetical protein Tco_1300441, partial [Tanacetum coccineum]
QHADPQELQEQEEVAALVLGLLLLLQANIPKKEVLAGFADGRLSIPLCQTSEDRDLLHEESGSNLMI